MPQYDLPLDALRTYRSDVRRPVDFDHFWTRTIDASRAVAERPTAVRVQSTLTAVETYDVTFSGYAGQPVRAWLHQPTQQQGRPMIVRYVGYNCGRGLPHVVSPMVLAGYAVLTMDNRGQGAVAGYRGDTPDENSFASLGMVLRGLESAEDYYYRRLFTDAVLAVDAARALSNVDFDRVAVMGGSQGGGIALVVAGLVQGLAAVLIDVPFLSDIPRATALTGEAPYGELGMVLASYPDRAEDIFRTLAYFDGTAFAATATAPALFSVGLMDTVCPPSTVYAAFNAYAAEKEMREYPYGGHAGGGFFHEAAQLEWLPQHLPV